MHVNRWQSVAAGEGGQVNASGSCGDQTAGGTPRSLPLAAAMSSFTPSSLLARRTHEGREGPRRDFAVLEHRELTERIIGLAIEVHRNTGPGLLESVYAAFLAFELGQAGIPLLRQIGVPVFYKGMRIPLGFRADLLVADTVILEIKAVPALLPPHEAQLLTYLRMSGLPVGLLMNFHAIRLEDGLRRFVASRRGACSAALGGPPAASVLEGEEE